MAKRGRPKGSKNKKKTTYVEKQNKSSKNMVLSTLFIVLGVLMLVIMVVSDKGVLGGAVQKGMQYLFSWVMYLLPVLLVHIGVLFALQKTRKYILLRSFFSLLALVFLSAIVFVLVTGSENMTALFNSDKVNAVGFGVGYVFIKLLGKAGGTIALFIFLLASLMLGAGLTIVSLFAHLKDFFTVRDEEEKEEVSVEAIKDIGVEEPKQKRKKRSSIDIPVDDPEPVEVQPVVKPDIRIDDIISRATAPAPEATVQEPVAAEAEKPAEDKPVHEQAEGNYSFPPISLLKKSVGGISEDVSNELKENADKLIRTLKSFGVSAKMSEVCRGPSVTRYELQPDAGVRISKIAGLADDIALSLAAESIRIEAPIPNKAAVGIEVPNRKRSSVRMRDLLETKEFAESRSRLTMALGKGVSGEPVVADLARMPHVLIAGATGSGKSVCINSIIMSILYKASPDEVKFIMIDPKAVELVVYNGIPHLAIPVVTNPKRAAGALDWAVREMMRRYKLFSDSGTRDIASYNLQAMEAEDGEPLPQYVIVIDELASLMMTSPKEVEESICKLAQLARSAGMHIVVATQRPSVDVITGLIKANIPTRIALAVTSQIDSRTIIDHGGAEKLLGRGDMLFAPIDASKAQRIQGCYLSDEEVHVVVDFIKEKAEANYNDDISKAIDDFAADKKEKGIAGFDGEGDGEVDEMLESAIEIAVEAQSISVSLLQRKLRLGYARAARLVDEMEERGIVGPYEGSKPRQVLLTHTQWMEMKNRQ